ncbi:hypothetical protein PFISCL1PPCAC_19416, partial [Pristionchus fissidentatus]
ARMGRGRSEADPALKRRNHKTKKDTGNNSGKTGFDGLTVAPWRKTVSIFKQPVTLVHTTRSRDNKKPTNEQLKRAKDGNQQKPVQLMWAKSLEGIEAVVPLHIADKIDTANDALPSKLELPTRISPATSIVSTEAASASFCFAIHNPHGGVVSGQKNDAKTIEGNPKGTIETEQPLTTAITVMDEDVKGQERRVIDARKRLQEIRKHFFT